MRSTARQRYHMSLATVQRMEIPEAIDKHWRENEYAPTVREVADMIGRSVGWTHEALGRLKGVGIVSWTPGVARTLRVRR